MVKTLRRQNAFHIEDEWTNSEVVAILRQWDEAQKQKMMKRNYEVPPSPAISFKRCHEDTQRQPLCLSDYPPRCGELASQLWSTVPHLHIYNSFSFLTAWRRAESNFRRQIFDILVSTNPFLASCFNSRALGIAY